MNTRRTRGNFQTGLPEQLAPLYGLGYVRAGKSEVMARYKAVAGNGRAKQCRTLVIVVKLTAVAGKKPRLVVSSGKRMLWCDPPVLLCSSVSPDIPPTHNTNYQTTLQLWRLPPPWLLQLQLWRLPLLWLPPLQLWRLPLPWLPRQLCWLPPPWLLAFQLPELQLCRLPPPGGCCRCPTSCHSSLSSRARAP